MTPVVVALVLLSVILMILAVFLSMEDVSE